MSDRTPMDRYLDRLERCLEADLKTQKARRREWRRKGGVEAEMKARFEAARKRIQGEKLRDANGSADDPKH